MRSAAPRTERRRYYAGMWYQWPKVERADIPADLRVQFEQLGEAVVVHIAGSPYTHATGQTPGVPAWAASPEKREHAVRWLAEQRSRSERRHDISETVEIAILVLVAIEALPILAQAIRSEWGMVSPAVSPMRWQIPSPSLVFAVAAAVLWGWSAFIRVPVCPCLNRVMGLSSAR